MRAPRAAISAVVVGGLLMGCAAQAAEPTEPLVVLAAASLHEVFEGLAEDFEAVHDVEVQLSFAGSSDLVAQVLAGAPADVLITADERTMARAADAGALAGEPVVVAHNHLVLVTPPDNPAAVTGLDGSLANADLVVCAPEVPCGAAALALAEARGIVLAPVSQEHAVTAVLATVVSGQADAGLVYATDASGADVATFPVPGAENLRNDYPIAAVSTSPVAGEWIAWVRGPQGRAALADAGFDLP